MIEVTSRIAIADSEISETFIRASGPGGQNVNKVNSKAVLRWNPGASPSLPPAVRDRLLRLVGNKLTVEGELLISSQATRDQGRNQEDCLDKVRDLVRSIAKPPRVRRATKPTHGSQERRIESKARHSETKRGRQKPSSD